MCSCTTATVWPCPVSHFLAVGQEHHSQYQNVQVGQLCCKQKPAQFNLPLVQSYINAGQSAVMKHFRIICWSTGKDRCAVRTTVFKSSGVWRYVTDQVVPLDSWDRKSWSSAAYILRYLVPSKCRQPIHQQHCVTPLKNRTLHSAKLRTITSDNQMSSIRFVIPVVYL